MVSLRSPWRCPLCPGSNVVEIGTLIEAKLEELQNIIPVGMQIDDIYNQPREVEKSVSGFVISVVEALIIVVVVLLFFMGLRVGLIIGAVLLITVSGTLWLMHMFGIELQRVSLGALIIALGMLVDNAIVVSEGMMIRIQRGMSAVKAGQRGCRPNQYGAARRYGDRYSGVFQYRPVR